MGNFQELKVWQRSKDLAVFLYKITEQGAFDKDWGLRDQIRRAVVSMPSNIAEGDELGTDRQAIKFFYTAKGNWRHICLPCTLCVPISEEIIELSDIRRA